MVRLGELLKNRGLITQDQLDQALGAQEQFGGRLGTNLVEMGFVTEEQLALALSQQFDTPFVRAEEVATITSEVIDKVPREVAEKYRVIPLRMDGRTLQVCLADPLDLERLDELAFALGLEIKPMVITEVTLNYALERYYRIRREVRFLRLSGTEPPEMRFISLSQGGGSDRAQFLRDSYAISGPPSTGRLTDVLAELADAKAEGEVLDVLARFLNDLYESVVIMAVRGATLVGAVSTGGDNRRTDITSLSITVAPDSLLAAAITKAQIVHRQQVTDSEVLRVCLAAGLPQGDITLIPVFENRKVTFIAIAHGPGDPDIKGNLEHIKWFLAKASCAFQIVALRKEIRTTKR